MNRYVCTVHTGNMQGSMSASSVQDPVNFTVSIESTNSPVVEGENLTTTVKVTNTGGQSGTQTVTGEIPGLAPPLSESITLEPGDSTTRVTPTPTEEGDAGNYTVEVSSQNDTASTNVTVQETPSSITSPVSGVSDKLWTEVTGDGQLTRGEVVGSIDAFFSGGEINGVSISRSDVVSLIEYFFSN
jgi:hypothetical protein